MVAVSTEYRFNGPLAEWEIDGIVSPSSPRQRVFALSVG